MTVYFQITNYLRRLPKNVARMFVMGVDCCSASLENMNKGMTIPFKRQNTFFENCSKLHGKALERI